MKDPNTSVEIIEREDKRVWPKYNSYLVNRIDVLMDTSFLDSWNESLERANEGKVGHPFDYPQEFFDFLAKIRSLWNVPFREFDGFVRRLSKLTGRFKPLSYVAIFNRIRDIPIMGMLEEINDEARDGITVIIDSSGLKITERGDWLTTKWKGKRRGWIKIHIAIDAEAMNVVSLTITDEHRSDTKEFRKVLNPIIGKASEVQGDKWYDSRSNFNYLHSRHVKEVILPRENARTLSRGSPARARVVREIRKMGIESWKEKVQY